ncbi:Alpha-tocopherol transfer protein [Cyphomyrmex costatus]|uniref:Alpha-tocopherol transfer protein n=1 Tax=Cyphomyrmex costatus TaxID=456900 RepID=A0A195CRX0_9HYME|nr:Alpha-tocopherol transfer protein [Cyphomyrmex costatus]
MANASSYDDSVKCYTRYELALTSEDKKYAATYLNETDEIRESAVAEIKRWIEENDDLPARMESLIQQSYIVYYTNSIFVTKKMWCNLSLYSDDFLILRFLRVAKFDVEKSKVRIRNYFKQRSDLPDWHMNIDPFRPELQEILDLGLKFLHSLFIFSYFLPLRKPDNQGRLVFITQGTRHDPKIHKIPDLFKVTTIVTEVAVKYYPAVSVYGYTIFVDMSNPTFGHIAQFRPNILMNCIHSWQSCFPTRVRSINIINVPVILDVIVKIAKSFMTEKLKNRFHVYSHKTMQNCFKDIPTSILPVEYGGTDGTIKELTGKFAVKRNECI